MSKEIKLFSGKTTIVDDEDYEMLIQYKWYETKKGYAMTGIYIGEYKTIQVAMHRMLLNAKKGQQVDHKNQNKLDNRKENLRFATDTQNRANQKPRKGKQYKGIWYDKRSRRYDAYISANNKRTYLGSYINEIDAARAYNNAAIKTFGEYAFLNDV